MVVEISDWNDLDNVRNDLTGDYVLVNDLDSDTAGYTGIGDDWNPIGEQAFDGNFYEGVFDGDGFEIRDLIVDTTDRNVGLFSGIRSPGEIRNLSFVGDITTTSGSFNAGVLCSENRGLIENCTAGGSVTALSIEVSGGLVGRNEGTLTDSYATGSVEGDDVVGGLVGNNRDTVTDSYATGSVEGNDVVGGLVGRNEDTITDSYATGSVEGDERVGGLVGDNRDTVTESYATGSVEGNDVVGGLVGRNRETIQTSYAVGLVTGNTDVGGLVGLDDDTVTDSYWDTETTGQDTSDGGTGLTTAEMQGSEAETNMDGFDFANVWSLVEEGKTPEIDGLVPEEDGYPILLSVDLENQLDAQNILLVVPPFDLTVETNPATNISEFSATLNGELVELDDEAEDADVFFEFGENVTDSQTAIQTLTGPATFDELLDELEPNTTFEFRAVAEAQDADNETFIDEGDVLTFSTDIVSLDGTISLDDAGVENADVLVHNFTQDVFEGRLSTDIDGNYAVDLPNVNRLDTIAVAVDFDDGTERYGRLVTTVLE